MRTVGIFEAKQKLSELVERASRGERIRITRRGKVAAEKPLPLGVTIKNLIEEGRR
jgi:hypothetical protein